MEPEKEQEDTEDEPVTLDVADGVLGGTDTFD